MSWDKDSILRASDTVGDNGTLWLLFLAGNTDVGVGKTSNAERHIGSVRTLAQDGGLSDPGHSGVMVGYSNITRKIVTDADGNGGPINVDKKSNNLLQLTTLGKQLLTTLDRDERIELEVRKSIGMNVDVPTEPWWPHGDPDESHPIYIRTFADRSVLDEAECEIEVIASFQCEKCHTDIEHSYNVRMESGTIVNGWSRTVPVDCENPDCDLTYEHLVGDPFRGPTPE
ncbi:hypothetical protein [Haloferax volcanii]|uniref:hypothetical protein n=1 Tax=Haloferax volcanii TaxID=2246 RepID=UPI00385360FB